MHASFWRFYSESRENVFLATRKFWRREFPTVGVFRSPKHPNCREPWTVHASGMVGDLALVDGQI